MAAVELQTQQVFTLSALVKKRFHLASQQHNTVHAVIPPNLMSTA
jgi:hypothetical protein